MAQDFHVTVRKSLRKSFWFMPAWACQARDRGCPCACWGDRELLRSGWRGHGGQIWGNWRRMAKTKDSCEGRQCMKLRLLMGPVTLSRHWSQQERAHHFPVETEGCWEVRASLRTPSLLMPWDQRRWSLGRTRKRKWLVQIGVLVGRYEELTISFHIYHMNTYLAGLPVLTIWVLLKTKSFLPWKVNHWGFGVRGRPLWITFFTVFPLLFLIVLSRREDSFILFVIVSHPMSISLLDYLSYKGQR